MLVEMKFVLLFALLAYTNLGSLESTQEARVALGYRLEQLLAS